MHSTTTSTAAAVSTATAAATTAATRISTTGVTIVRSGAKTLFLGHTSITWIVVLLETAE
jgi:hypothetical protein